MSASVYLLVTLDTKGIEAAYLRDRLCSLGLRVLLVDTSTLGPPRTTPDVTREAIFGSVGTSAIDVRLTLDRRQAVAIAAEGVATFIREKYVRGDVAGVLGLGGGAGTIIGTAAMRALPLGVPKLMVSTLTSGQIRQN